MDAPVYRGSATNNAAAMNPMPAYYCPSDPIANSRNNVSNYRGVQGGGTTMDCGAASYMFYTNGLLFVNSNIRFRDITDGTSNVFLLGESYYNSTIGTTGGAPGNSANRAMVWAMAASFRNDGRFPGNLASTRNGINSWTGNPDTTAPYTTTSIYFSSRHTGGCYFLMADGSAHFVNQYIDSQTYQRLGIRNDGLPVSGFAF